MAIDKPQRGSAATPQNNRFHRVCQEPALLAIAAALAVHNHALADEWGDQQHEADGVQVWVDPLHDGKTRAEPTPCCGKSLHVDRGKARIRT